MNSQTNALLQSKAIILNSGKSVKVMYFMFDYIAFESLDSLEDEFCLTTKEAMELRDKSMSFCKESGIKLRLAPLTEL